MRGTKVTFVVLGVILAAAGAGGVVWALGTDSVAGMGIGLAGGSLLFVGIVFLFVARYLGGLDDRQTLANGIPGTAQVLSVRDTGVTISNLNAVVAAQVQVTIPTRPPYPAEMKIVLHGRTSWGAIQPGMTIPVKVDPDDPDKVVLDRERPVLATPAGMPGMAGVAGVPGVTGGGTPVVTMSTADIVARGVATTGRLLTVEPTGLTAGHVAAGLPAEHADDPVVKIGFTFAGPAGELRSEALMRVPDGKAAYLATGATVPIRYLADTPSTATIDWDRL